ncbi:MAG: hypothetical protein WBP13_12535 [Methylophilaceae bacterium]
MAKNRFNSLVPMTLLIGLTLGSVVSIFLMKKFNGPAMVSFEGSEMQNNALHEDLFLNEAIILNKPKFNKALTWRVFKIFSYSTLLFSAHYDPNDSFSIKNKNKNEVFDLRERVQRIFKGYFSGKMSDLSI